ncbi:MAG: hypothetical protein OHK0013_46370 [Sandaracinaceae bacterium]
MRGSHADRRPLLAAIHLAVALSGIASLAPMRAQAWTDATVRTASADVTLTPDGRAHVAMRARVRVEGGWLQGLDLEGLDPDAALDPEHPAAFRDAAGISLPVEVSARSGGRVGLRFPRRNAPRRGEYDLELAWTTALDGAVEARSDDRLRVRWVFPAWRYGLDAVEIRWHVPRGAHAPQADDPLSPVEIERLDAETWTFRRAHLPRTCEWVTEMDVPASAWPHAVTAHASSTDDGTNDEAPELVPVTAPPTGGPPETPNHRTTFALLVAVGALVKRHDLAQRSERTRRKHATLVPAPRWLAWLASGALSGAASLSPWLAVPKPLLVVLAGLVVALGWQRTELREVLPRMHALSPVAAAHVRAARRDAWLGWLAPAAWLEPSRLGVVSSGIALAVAASCDGPTRALAAFFVAVVASGTRTRLGPDPATALRSVARALQGLRVELEGPALSFALLARGTHVPTDPRVRIHASFIEPRLSRAFEHLQLELLADPVDGSLRLRASARAGTSADIALRAWAEAEGYAFADDTRRTTVDVPVTRSGLADVLRESLASLARLAPRERDATVEEPLAAE